MEATRIVYEIQEGRPHTFTESIRVPEIKEGEVLGKILAATICGSDLHTLSGKRQEVFPSILGHEGVIEIVESRRPFCNLKRGDRASFHIADCCRKCTLCLSGVQQKCRQLFKVTVFNTTFDHLIWIQWIIWQTQLFDSDHCN